jgi:hypothetical protein
MSLSIDLSEVLKDEEIQLLSRPLQDRRSLSTGSVYGTLRVLACLGKYASVIAPTWREQGMNALKKCNNFVIPSSPHG